MTVDTDPAGTDPVETDPVETGPAGTEPAGTGLSEIDPAKAEPRLEASALADLTATVSAMGKQLTDLSAAVIAIANQGSVNQSIKQDNRETGEEEYPTIDIDGINRLLGV